MMSNKEFGNAAAVGMIAGPQDFERMRKTSATGRTRTIWKTLIERVKNKSASLSEIALAAAVRRNAQWANEAIASMCKLCDMPFWGHHEAGVMSLGGMDKARDICLAADWLWPVLNRDCREKILGGLLARAVENLSPAPDGVRDEGDGNGQLLLVRRLDVADPFCLHPRPHQTNNWDMWFAATLFMAAALARRAWLNPEPDEPALGWGRYFNVGYALDEARIERWQSIARERIHTTLNNVMGEDGDYGEGLNYARYGGEAALLALTLLDRLDGNNLFKGGILELPSWYCALRIADPEFGYVNFNDSLLNMRHPTALLTHLAARTRRGDYQTLALEAIDGKQSEGSVLVLIGLDETIPPGELKRPGASHFRKTGTVVWRTATDRDGIFFALQSGAHGGAHQHRDRNSFFLSAYGEHLIVDSGDGRYTPGGCRPPHDATLAHNCILVNNREQSGSNEDPVAGRIVTQTSDDDISTLLADSGGCYPGVTECTRQVVFSRPDLLVMCDRVTGACERITWLLQGYNADGRASWTTTADGAVLVRPAASLHVFFAEPAERITIAPGALDGECGGILRLEAVFHGKQVGAAFVPCRSSEKAPMLMSRSSGKLTLRFRSREHTVHFAQESILLNGTAHFLGGT